MSSIARLETTYAYNKQKVVIDVADLMNTEGYYEAIAMSPDGRIEYEVMHTKDRQEALDAFELYKLRAQGGYPEGVYTKEQWHKDGSFNAFPGQEVSREVYDEMLDVLPPLSLPIELRSRGFKGFMVGEPKSSNSKGLTFDTFVRMGWRCYYQGALNADRGEFSIIIISRKGVILRVNGYHKKASRISTGGKNQGRICQPRHGSNGCPVFARNYRAARARGHRDGAGGRSGLRGLL